MSSNFIYLTLDNDDDLISLKYRHFLVWPLIRYQVLQTIVDNENILNSPQEESKKNYFKKIFNLILSFSIKDKYDKRFEYLFFTSSFSNVLVNKQYQNRISDSFSELLFKKDNILVIDESNFDKLFYKRLNKYKFIPKELINLKIKILSKLNKENDNIVNNKVQIVFSVLAKYIFLSNFHQKKLSSIIVDILNCAIQNEKYYNKLFKNSNFKCIFHEDGHYSSEKAIINYCAHKNNIQIIELQHGFVNKNHPCYYFGDKSKLNPFFKLYFPDFFLTYGNFWSKEVQIPGKAVKIGNPYLIKKLFTEPPKIKNIVLVIGSGVSVEETKLLLKKLLLIKENFIIKYRPHPQELLIHKERYKSLYEQGVQVDKEELYNSLSSSKIIVTELSTVLFESIFFCEYINLLNSNYTKTYITNEISHFNIINIDQINNITDLKHKINKTEAIKFYWEQNWKQNFFDFFKNLLHE